MSSEQQEGVRGDRVERDIGTVADLVKMILVCEPPRWTYSEAIKRS